MLYQEFFHRTQPKGWMDSGLFLQWVKEKRSYSKLPDGMKRVIFVDIAGGHKITDDVIEELDMMNTMLRVLPKSASDLCQPADSFIIHKVIIL